MSFPVKLHLRLKLVPSPCRLSTWYNSNCQSSDQLAGWINVRFSRLIKNFSLALSDIPRLLNYKLSYYAFNGIVSYSWICCSIKTQLKVKQPIRHSNVWCLVNERCSFRNSNVYVKKIVFFYNRSLKNKFFLEQNTNTVDKKNVTILIFNDYCIFVANYNPLRSYSLCCILFIHSWVPFYVISMNRERCQRNDNL